VFIVDLMLEGSSGVALIKELKMRRPDTPLLVLSMHDEAVYAERTLKAGTHVYIMKEAATNQTLTELRRVLAGEVYVSERMGTRILHRMVGIARASASSN
jgi:DNA-binding NarL/FixJ family response regulator